MAMAYTLAAETPLPRGKNAQRLLRAWAKALPKIDLHRHLEGSLRLQTLSEIALEHGIDLPSYDIEQLRPYVQVTDDYPDFHRFLEKFKLLRRFYTSKEAVQRITREAIIDADEDNIRYLELRFNPVALSRAQGFPLADVVEWVIDAVKGSREWTSTRTCLILQIGREESLHIAEEIVDLAIAFHGPLVRAIDLAGDEVNYPAKAFKAPFQRARAAGLHITVHAGEAAGPDSIYDAITLLGAERIGHGIHAVESSEVIHMLSRGKIALEVCPTSNFQTGAVLGLTAHPLKELFGLRLRVTINTDDPSVSDTTLTDEYLVAVKAIGIQQRLIFRALRDAIDSAFIPDAEREPLRALFVQQLSAYPEAAAEFR